MKNKINNLKVIIIILMMVLCRTFCFGQIEDDTTDYVYTRPVGMSIDSLYENKDELLLYSKVEQFDSIPQTVLNTKIKNWAGTYFVDMNKVLVSETNEQLVFCYITDSYYMKTLGIIGPRPWYIRMVVKVKDNKIKILMYDDGNAYWPGNSSSSPTSPRTYYFKSPSTFLYSTFNKKGNSTTFTTAGLVNFKQTYIKTVSDLISSIKSTDVKETNEDW